MHRYSFPEATLFDRIIAKEKIFKQNAVNATIKKIFQEQVEQIRCYHDLTEEGLNLKSSTAVPKIIIIQVFQKVELLDERILLSIDSAFGVPLIFELLYQNKYRYAACYRRRNEKDDSKWVFSDYFVSNWVASDQQERKLPIKLSLEALYETFIRELLPFQSDEPLDALVAKISRIHKLEREAEKLESRINNEKQFNRRVELNRNLNKIKAEIDNIKK